MGSVQDWIDCPKCKSNGTYVTDYYYKSGELYAYCTECGYVHEIKAVYDRIKTKRIYDEAQALMDAGKKSKALKLLGIKKEHEFVLADYLKRRYPYFKRRKDGKQVYRVKEEGGYGAYHVDFEGLGRMGSFNEPVSQGSIDAWVDEVINNPNIKSIKIMAVTEDGLVEVLG